MTFSIWLLLSLISVAIGFVSVALTRSDRMIGRAAFLVRLFGIFMFGVALAFILKRRDENLANAIFLLYILAAYYLIPYWATARQRDIGIDQKYWAVLTNVPVAGWLYTIYLLCAKSAGELPAKDNNEDLPPIVLMEPTAIEAKPSDRDSNEEQKRIGP